MGDFVEVAVIGELRDGSVKMVSAGGRRLLVARVGDSCYAVDDVCPHMGARLSGGKLEGTVITCPRHGSQFDVTDGHVVRWTDFPRPVAAVARIVKSPKPLTTYPVRLEGDRVLVEL